MKKIKYVDNDGNELKKVMISFEITYTGEGFQTIMLLPKDMTDEEITEIATRSSDTETTYSWSYLDEEEEEE